MPSGPIGVGRLLVAVLLGASSTVHRDAQVASAAVGSALRVPTAVTTLSQAATDKSVSEHARGQQLADAEHPERRLDVFVRSSTAKCIEGQSFRVWSRWCPQFNGCYSASGKGRIPSVSGEFEYALSKGAGGNTVVGRAGGPGNQHTFWRLSSKHSSNESDRRDFCGSRLTTGHPHHPADGVWSCMHSGNTTDVPVPDATGISVTCGCAGPPQTDFDKQAALLNENRATELREKKYNSGHSGGSSKSEAFPALLFLVMGVVGVAVCSENIKRDRTTRRSQESLRERDGQTGVELPERRPAGFPLHYVGERVVEPAQ